MLIMFVILFILSIFMIKNPLEGQIHVSTHLSWWSDMMKIKLSLLWALLKESENVLSFLI